MSFDRVLEDEGRISGEGATKTRSDAWQAGIALARKF